MIYKTERTRLGKGQYAVQKSVHFLPKTTTGKERYAKVNITHANMVLKTKFSQISQQINT